MMPFKHKTLLQQILIGIVPVVLPFVFFPFTIDPVLAPAFMAIGVAVLMGFLYYAVSTNASSSTTVSRKYLLVWLAWLVLNIASLFYTSNVADNWFEIARIVLWISLLLGGSIIIKQVPNAVQAYSRGIIIACIAEGLFGFYQIAPNILLLLRNADYSYYVTGSMAHKNLFSSGLMLMMPFGIYALIKDKGTWRLLAFVALLIAVLDIVILQSRAVWVALAITIAATTLLAMVAKNKNGTAIWQLERKYKNGFAAFVVIGFILLTIFQPLAYKRQYERVKTSIQYNGPHTQANETIRERLMLWRNTIAIWKDAPIFGKGTSSWEIEMPAYGLADTRMEQGYTFFQRPHNDFLWVLSENGVLGIIVYLLLFLMPLYWLVKSVLKSSDDPTLSLSVFFGIVAWMVNAVFDFPSERNTHMFMLIVMLAMAQSRKENSWDIAPFKRMLSVLVVVMLIPVLIIAYLRIAGEYHTRNLYYAHVYEQYQTMIDEGEKSRSFVYQIDPISAPIIWYEGTAYYSMNNYNEALRCFKASYQLSPYHLPTLNNLGSCYERLNDKPMALETYKKALVLAPKFEETLLNVSAIYFNQRQLDSAYTTIAKCDTASTNPRYLASLKSILKVEIQTLINAGQLSDAQAAKALEWKNDLPMMKDLLKGAMYNHIPYQQEVKDRLVKYGYE